MVRNGTFIDGFVWHYRSNLCPNCNRYTVQVGVEPRESTVPREWMMVHPRGIGRDPAPPQVPVHIASDYTEACEVLAISAKASAAVSRRCLQVILRAHGYQAKDLAKEIDLLLNESDPRKAIPATLRVTVDGIRNFGNFSAHPITDQTTLQIIDVEPEEAEWCLEIIEEMFAHFYVRPAQALARKAALDVKLDTSKNLLR